ncbi:Baeyer-Villiger monooxygenase [Vanrija pseudolonga]|uniref:Baeyer-Villiger monooxygenase n=1 Tax=Vanrija pseudolonga TaxID=143232 RepID=A0AAF0Y5R2_9TREE|nr:Baeyer-Villiger monooxygenase [Vanrija pseudolonga]
MASEKTSTAVPTLVGAAEGSPFVAAKTINSLANPSVLIVGAGIGGITLALDLDDQGLTNWIMIDREAGVGGTWWQNRYPIPAVAYSHSRFQNSQWTETHPERAELQEYWANIVKTQGLENRLRLQHDFVKADWDAEASLYHVTLRDTANDREVHVDAQVIVGATGAFSEPRRIPLPGEDQFKGQIIHSARWPHDLAPSDLRGKTVVVVGNGCSGVRIVGTLGLDPKIKVVSLARTQQWLMPSLTRGWDGARNSAPNSEQLRDFRARFPFFQKVYRLLMLAILDSRFKTQLIKEGKSRRKVQEKAIGEWMRKRAPPHLKDKIVPDFPFQAKRYVFEDGYFAAINSPQNRAIYGRVTALTENGVQVDDGSHVDADVVVLSTGYDADHIDMEVSGSTDSTNNYNGKGDQVWYHGVALPGIPNYFTLCGNNFLVNHSSVTIVLEFQAAYVTKLIAAMRDNSIPVLEVKQDAAEKYDQIIAKKLEKTTWPLVNNYWRKGGSGRIFTHYPGPVVAQWWDNAWVVWSDYKGGEKLARSQRIRSIAYTVALLVGLAYGGKWAVDSGLVHRLGVGAQDLVNAVVHAATAAKDVVVEAAHKITG